MQLYTNDEKHIDFTRFVMILQFFFTLKILRCRIDFITV